MHTDAQRLVCTHSGYKLIFSIKADHGTDSQMNALPVLQQCLIDFRIKDRRLHSYIDFTDSVIQNELYNTIGLRGILELPKSLFDFAAFIQLINPGSNRFSQLTVYHADSLHGILLEKAGIDAAKKACHIFSGADYKNAFSHFFHHTDLARPEYPLPNHTQRQ